MKPLHSDRVTSDGDLQPIQGVEMTLDQDSLPHLMDILTTLYSNSLLAATREPASNAYDSHRANGTNAPIEVSLPTEMNPVYVVRDRGVGMSVDDLLNIYSKYGRSTKRGSNLESGMLGIGAKAALAYTDHFTIEAVKDGVRTVASVALHSDDPDSFESGRTPRVDILDTSATDDVNGVTVQIPLDGDLREFVETAQKFFRFWEAGTVLVDGVDPAETQGRINIADDVEIIPASDRYRSTLTVVMGNVPYTVDFEEVRNFTHVNAGYYPNATTVFGFHADVVVRLPIGTIEFATSRESLKYTERTKAVIREIAEYVYEFGNRALRDAIDAEDTPQDAWMLFSKVFPNKNPLLWRGQRIETNASAYNSWKVDPWGRSEKVSSVSVFNNNYTAMVTGFDLGTFTPRHRQKVQKYLSDRGALRGKVLVCRGVGSQLLAQTLPSFPWSEVREVELPREERKGAGAGVPVMLYSVRGDGSIQRRASYRDELDRDLPIVLLSSESSSLLTLLHHTQLLGDGYLFVSMHPRSHEKFLREFPKSVRESEYAVQKWKEVSPRLRGKLLWAVGRAVHPQEVEGWPSRITSELVRVKDPLLAREARFRLFWEDNHAHARNLAGLAARAGEEIEVPEGWDDDLVTVLERYPLLGHLDAYNVPDLGKHVVEYVNLLYTAKYEEN